MPSFIKNTSGGKSVSGGALAPRSRRGNTNQADGYWRGGSVSLNAPLTLEYLVIAGGGTAGTSLAGAGAGGYRTNKSGQTSGQNSSAEATFNTPTSAFTVTVGAVGGNNSVMATITSTGGGNSQTDFGNGQNGGSGSGARGGFISTATGGTGTTNQGFGGGNSFTEGLGYPGGGGGGGGAGGSGTNGTATSYPSAASGGVGGNGGSGINNNITGTAVARASGKGGGGNYSRPAGSDGGAGGVNTGSGGFSGVVIIAYDVTKDVPTIDAGLTYSVNDGVGRAGFKVITFTAGTGTVSW